MGAHQLHRQGEQPIREREQEPCEPHRQGELTIKEPCEGAYRQRERAERVVKRAYTVVWSKPIKK